MIDTSIMKELKGLHKTEKKHAKKRFTALEKQAVFVESNDSATKTR